MTTKNRGYAQEVIGEVTVQGAWAPDGGRMIEVWADGAWYHISNWGLNGSTEGCTLHYGWADADIKANRAGNIYRPATEAEALAARALNARHFRGWNPDPRSEWGTEPDKIAAEEASLEAACEAGLISGAAAAD